MAQQTKVNLPLRKSLFLSPLAILIWVNFFFNAKGRYSAISFKYTMGSSTVTAPSATKSESCLRRGQYHQLDVAHILNDFNTLLLFKIVIEFSSCSGSKSISPIASRISWLLSCPLFCQALKALLQLIFVLRCVHTHFPFWMYKDYILKDKINIPIFILFHLHYVIVNVICRHIGKLVRSQLVTLFINYINEDLYRLSCGCGGNCGGNQLIKDTKLRRN